MATLSKGNKAPAFTLINTEKKEISLDAYYGKNVLILFFPLAFTSVCTAELCSARDNIAMYNGLDTEVLGISVDSPFALGEFKKQQQINFELLSDFNKSAAAAYGALYEDFVLGLKGVAKRAAFVVDKNGDIAYAEVLEDAGQLPDFEAVKTVLSTL